MKKYVSAFVEIVSLEESDVIVTSTPVLFDGTADGDEFVYSDVFKA